MVIEHGWYLPNFEKKNWTNGDSLVMSLKEIYNFYERIPFSYEIILLVENTEYARKKKKKNRVITDTHFKLRFKFLQM